MRSSSCEPTCYPLWQRQVYEYTGRCECGSAPNWESLPQVGGSWSKSRKWPSCESMWTSASHASLLEGQDYVPYRLNGGLSPSERSFTARYKSIIGLLSQHRKSFPMLGWKNVLCTQYAVDSVSCWISDMSKQWRINRDVRVWFKVCVRRMGLHRPYPDLVT